MNGFRRFLPRSFFILHSSLFLFLSACSNNPYRPGEAAKPVYFSSFDEPPSKMDPARAYYSHEGEIIGQIYEPPLTYHFLKRPYEVIPLTAAEPPKPTYYGNDGKVLDDSDPPADLVARVEYTVRLKRGILYQNHPCFAKDADGAPCYRNVKPADIERFEWPTDFERQGARELRARDYALQIRRLADPRLTCPIFSTIEQYMEGMSELQKAYTAMLEEIRKKRKDAKGAAYNQEKDEKDDPILLDYMKPDLPGVEVLDDYAYRIVLKRKYPQILYWLCMHFFGPMPQEALDFYTQPAMAEKQFSINRCPVGTGPYYLKVFRPNELIVLERNPNYHEDFYPTDGNPGDAEAGLLADAGQRLPFIRTQYYHSEKEAITHWHKFLSGYYDASGIANDVFDKAVNISRLEGPQLSDSMIAQGIRLITDVDTSLFYLSFNMLDNVVGGYDEKRAKLRRAVSIAMDSNEFLNIFLNGRGIAAQGPIPPGIFGYRSGEEGTNPFVSAWDPKTRRHVRRPLETARKLMEEAGYPGGVGPDGKPLTLYYDHSQGGDTAFRAQVDWTRKKMALIGIRLEERGTDLTRYREKRQQGNWQLGGGGWLADYPDPENFLFLFYGPNREAQKDGPNMTNYENKEFDDLFGKMESMGNTLDRQNIIDRMVAIIQRDAPAVWQFHPVSFALTHRWYRNVKPHQMSYNVMRYKRVEPGLRIERQNEWNRPMLWPVVLLAVILLAGAVPAAVVVYRKERGL
ncbi:MAG: ABC transporter substrate-binding protein [Verrucomicrobiota bacterium]|nr:ABC transporter substrate-binding protein [Verrucomicrobiota bacterium]